MAIYFGKQYNEPNLTLEENAIGQLLYCTLAHESLPRKAEEILKDLDTDTLPDPLNIIVLLWQRGRGGWGAMEVLEVSLPGLIDDAVHNLRKKNAETPLYSQVKSAPQVKEEMIVWKPDGSVNPLAKNLPDDAQNEFDLLREDVIDRANALSDFSPAQLLDMYGTADDPGMKMD